MAVNKVMLQDGTVLIDIANDTITADTALEGVVGHDKRGNVFTGTIRNNGDLSAVIDIDSVKEFVIPAGFTSGGTLRFVTPTHYYYNGVRLPKLPSTAADYPYRWIRNNASTGYYDLIMSVNPFYFDATRLTDGGTGDIWHRISISSAGSATSWGSAVSNSYSGWTVDSSRPVMWSSHDVPTSKGATTVYFAGSDPVAAT